MNPHDPNLAQIELIAHALGDLRDKLVFVGGCAVGLLMTDTISTAPRVTYDVDLVVEVTALRGYHQMEAEFSRRGFTRDISPEAPICRWKYRGLEVDLMPTDSSLLGFANRWYPLVVATAKKIVLPNGLSIWLITAPLFVATKFEAFADRGNEDILGSHDLEDIINVIDGRPELFDEICSSAEELQIYLAGKCASLLALPNFMNYLPGLVAQDEILAERVAMIAARLHTIESLKRP